MTKWTWNELARSLHRGEVLARDAQAIQRGRIGQRLINRAMGRGVSRAMRRIWR